MDGPEVLIPLTMFISIGAVFITWIMARHRERMSAMERGMTPEMMRSLFGKEMKRRDKFKTLKWGMMFLFMGIAFAVVSYLDSTLERFSDGFKFAAIALSIGSALILTYYIAGRQEEKDEPTSESSPPKTS